MEESVGMTVSGGNEVVRSCAFCSSIVDYRIGEYWRCQWTKSVDEEIRDFLFHQQCTDCADSPKASLYKALPPLRIDWPRVRTWLKGCDKEHGVKCNPGPLESVPPGFRLIDTQKGCLVGASPPCTYAALSYVWGATANSYVQATKSTIKALETEGYLFKKSLPATINDAICVCSHLHVRYLWVDRLCIVQDDGAVKDAQINAMGDIYRHSSVTLVDLDGSDMNHGLPGMTQVRDTAPMIYQTQGMCLRAMHTSYQNLVEQSTWGSRGWTYQEAMLSPKLLLFSNTGVFYECSGYVEALHEDRFVTGSSERPCFSGASSYIYSELVRKLTWRTLTFDSDILKAASGILHWRYGSEHYFGLPFREFTWGMLWRVISFDEEPVARIQEADSMFPSWSWSSVKGIIGTIDAVRGSLLLGAWGIPSTDHEASVRIIRPYSVGADFIRGWNNKTITKALGVILAWKGGCFPEHLPPMLNFNTTWRQYSDMITSKWASFDHFVEEALGVNTIHLHRIFSSSSVEHTRHPGALLANTQSVHVQVVGFPSSRQSRQVKFGTMSNESVVKIRTDTATAWDWLSDNHSRNPDACFDLLALSLCYSSFYKGYYSEPDTKQNFWYDSNEDVLRWRLDDPESYMVRFEVNVMVVETKEGVSRRIGIGEINLRKWISAPRESRNFVLV
ncbi:HET-domain-containing protein [Aspergillus sclerotioniger CBS 115572]|uniref:HET-domain-containing protein n=1 Tax=Aspergillus sclerotioniger CBS 115572 TaxID=1450535 RepID=A0A317XBS7_9EURO|nr:HET-domain-containing protein [Aspergillus sclerotioniger CBS 115572]PWY95785.1 HET-domain-containing protein [Aspergillus sclerotioniger CBS 115572]